MLQSYSYTSSPKLIVCSTHKPVELQRLATTPLSSETRDIASLQPPPPQAYSMRSTCSTCSARRLTLFSHRPLSFSRPQKPFGSLLLPSLPSFFCFLFLQNYPRNAVTRFWRGCQDVVSVYGTAKLQMPGHFGLGDHSARRQMAQLGMENDELITIGQQFGLVGTELGK